MTSIDEALNYNCDILGDMEMVVLLARVRRDLLKLEAERDELKTALDDALVLMKEIYEVHRDPNAADYNHCDNNDECQWCIGYLQLANRR